MALDIRTRVGFVGVNERAKRLLLRGLSASPRARLAAVCSRNPDKATQTAATLGPDVLAFDSVEEMVRSGEVDAVFVNTPVETHFDICMATIQDGCAVICEKPLAANTSEAAELRKSAAAAGVRTVVNFTYRSMPGYRLTERLLAEGGLGQPLHCDFALLQGHNFLPDFSRSSALLDSGVHLFDAIAGLGALARIGPISQVCAAPMVAGSGPDFGWGFTARTESDVLVSATFSRSALGWHNGLRWSLFGHERAITVELDSDRTDVRMACRAEGRPQGSWLRVKMPSDLQADYDRFAEYHMDRLVAAVRNEERFPGFAEAEATHRFADALTNAAATGRWVKVEP